MLKKYNKEYSHYFIDVEGIDGSGKDTQLMKLVELVKDDNNGIYGDKYSNIWVTREPTLITKPGKEISHLLRQPDKPDKEEASKLFISDRIEHSKLIREFLSHSDVVSSRYDLSTLTYQMTQGMEFDTLYNMHKYGEKDGAMIPDLTIVFDLPASVALKRTGSRNSEIECFDNDRLFLEKTRDSTMYCIDELRKRDGRNIIIVNADQSIEEVTKEMHEKLKQYLPAA